MRKSDEEYKRETSQLEPIGQNCLGQAVAPPTMPGTNHATSPTRPPMIAARCSDEILEILSAARSSVADANHARQYLELCCPASKSNLGLEQVAVCGAGRSIGSDRSNLQRDHHGTASGRRQISRISSLQRAAIIGAVVGLVAWFVPGMVGGGDSLTQAILSNRFEVGSLVVIFLVRFLIGQLSYVVGAPGGLFAPLVLLGAASGALFAGAVNHLVGGAHLDPVACAIVGVGALFTASVRAPLTGIVLAVEMTGRADLLLDCLARR